MEPTSQPSKSKKRKVNTVKSVQKRKKGEPKTQNAGNGSEASSENKNANSNKKVTHVTVNSKALLEHT